MSSIDELVQPLTAAQVETAIYSAMSGRGLTTSDWKPGAVVRTIVTALAIVLAALTVLIAFIAKSGFLEFANDEWLDLVATHVYGTDRIQEAFATGIVRVTNTTGAGSFISVQPGDLVVRNAGGKTYRSTAVFSLAATPGVYADVPVRADEAGSASSTGANTITSFVTTFVGCSVTNAVALVGSDAEKNEALRARARAKTGVLSPNGPRDAYSYLAKSAKRADGTAIGATRVRCIPDGVGGIDVYVADADGVVTGTVGDEDTDLGIIDRDIQEQSTPLCITARLHSATATTIGVSYELWVDSAIGFTEAELETAINAALAKYLGSVPIGGELLPAVTGGYVYRSAIAAAITSVVGLERLLRLDLTAPAGNTSISATQAPLLGSVSATIHLVSSLGVV
ncbi:MAG: baseplate J/gp47 family protein [Deltaproteobacteria bacterium]|nr:baseplate J/gp47 family protein [Deltaproteobacteria bacterium]